MPAALNFIIEMENASWNNRLLSSKLHSRQDQKMIFIGSREGWTLEGEVWHPEKD
ncbi:hypothetical protein HMI46_24305 [Paenibacillus alvei]|uniref:Uncharacterized protein n=1 Tax=Paenibacillus alvei TaxID=44250 RepID=A0AAP7A110_PAEAL|nr:hypothetical protein [Paenibacillus alvei]